MLCLSRDSDFLKKPLAKYKYHTNYVIKYFDSEVFAMVLKEVIWNDKSGNGSSLRTSTLCHPSDIHLLKHPNLNNKKMKDERKHTGSEASIIIN
jgi:hypothetical protein